MRKTDATAQPLVSIGIPVYNEEAFLEESLASFLSQDYPNIEFIISDNGSTDKTALLCREAAGKDPRVIFHRFEGNRGIWTNFNKVLEMARGEYFAWASGHDLWSPNLADSCAALLASHPDAALAFATSCWIDADGKPLSREYGWTDTRGMDAISRFFAVLWGNVHPFFGLFRLLKLKRLRRLPAMVGGDLVILCELALSGDFLHAPDAMLYRRQPRKVESHGERLQRYRTPEFKVAASALDRFLPMAGLPVELVKVVLRSGLSPLDKAAVLGAMATAFPVRYLAGLKETEARKKIDGP